MTELEYVRLIEQIKANAARRRREIDEEERRQLESLETVRKLILSLPDQSSDQSSSPKAFHEPAVGTLPLVEAIREVMPTVKEIFSINEILNEIENRGFDVKKPINPTSVSGALRKMHAAGGLELVEAGKGKRPSFYRLPTEQPVSGGSNKLPPEEKGQMVAGTTV